MCKCLGPRGCAMEEAEVGFVIDTEGKVPIETPTYVQDADRDGIGEKDEVEERLEEILFGKQPSSRVIKPIVLDSESEAEDNECDISGNVDRQERRRFHGKRPAWVDEDDERISVDITANARTKKLKQTEGETVVSGSTYTKRLRLQYEKLLGQPEWATQASKSKRRHRQASSGTESSDEEGGERSMLQRTGDLLKTSSDHLPKGRLDIKRMKDANRTKKAESVVRALEFHPSANVVLVAGYHKTLDLFEVDGQTNQRLQSVHVKDFPISTAHFTQDGTEVIMAGRKKRFFVYDMIAGKVTPIHGIRGRDEKYFDRFVVSPDNQYLVFLGENGYILLVSNKTKQWVGELRMNGDVHSACFTQDSRFMLSTGRGGKVYVWDMTSRQCVRTFVDEGCIVGTGIAVSPDQRYVACGSDSGVVNVYTGDQCLYSTSNNPKPVKALMNLTTEVNSISINHTSELMTIGSQRKKDAVRVVHLPTQTVFSNWPSVKSQLNYVSAMAVSPHSKYLALGNARGKALLYRLNHYSQQSLDTHAS